MAASLLSTHQEESTVRKVVRKRTNQWLAICQRLLATAVVTLVSAPMVFASGAHQIFELGDFALESGVVLPSAKLSYVTHRKTRKRDNAIHTVWFTLETINTDLIKPACPRPRQVFYCCHRHVPNGLSSSPSNTPPPFDCPNFPAISIRDNVAAVIDCSPKNLPHPYQGSDRLFHGRATGVPVGGQPP